MGTQYQDKGNLTERNRGLAENKKYYWLKLKRDFFKRHDIRIIEEMPNGKDYILFYLKMLLESTSDKYFSSKNPREIARLTNENIEFVKDAISVLLKYGFICKDEYEDLYIPYVTKETVYSCAEETGRDRTSKDYKLWRLAVYERDDFTCQECGSRGVRLNAHHIKSWRKHPDLRFAISNGITLCESCHKKKHKKGRIE